MYYVYILYSKRLKRFYSGYTENINRRLGEHNSCQVKYTSKGVPWVLVFYEFFIEKSDAIREEKFLKTGKGRERRKYLLETYIKKRIK